MKLNDNMKWNLIFLKDLWIDNKRENTFWEEAKSQYLKWFLISILGIVIGGFFVVGLINIVNYSISSYKDMKEIINGVGFLIGFITCSITGFYIGLRNVFKCTKTKWWVNFLIFGVVFILSLIFLIVGKNTNVRMDNGTIITLGILELIGTLNMITIFVYMLTPLLNFIPPFKVLWLKQYKNEINNEKEEKEKVNGLWFDYKVIHHLNREEIKIIGLKNKLSNKNINNLIIPNKINERPVTIIGEEAFVDYKNELNGIIKLPNTLREIRPRAFAELSNLTGDLIIPNSVIRIGEEAFDGCFGLDGKLILSDSMKIIERKCFYLCSKLMGNLIIPNNVTKIEEEAFNGCELLGQELVLSPNIEVIEEKAFFMCRRFNGVIKLNSNIKRIEKDSFSYTNIQSIENGNGKIDEQWKE
ncbi:MAG: leucine-rich repeat domain-containing protein [Mycoplasma sp.]